MTLIRALFFALVAALIASSPSFGTPIEYHLAFDVLPPPSGNGTELHGAHMELDIQFDAAQLSPTSDMSIGSPPFRLTEWPTTNTTSTLTVTNSAAADGVYTNPSFLFGGWRLTGNTQGGDISFPTLDFSKNGFLIRILSMAAAFGPGHYPDPTATLYPQPFVPADVKSWNAPDLVSSTNRHITSGITASAVVVPEPSAFAIAATSLFALSAIRRRASISQ